VRTPAELAAEQASLWNGPGGEMWLAAYDRRIDRDLRPYGQAALDEAAARPGERVLDIGCGTGGTTADLARAVAPDGTVLGVDISETLVAAARRQAIANARFEIGDAATHPFEPKSFDLLFSRFGVMFFGDAVAAFRHLHGALKATGRIVFICWRSPQENPWGLVPFMAAARHLPPMQRPGPEEPGQYAFGDRARVERILKASGFGAPRIRPVDHPIRLGKDIRETLDNLGKFGLLARAFASSTPDQVRKALEAVAAALEPHARAEGVILPGAAWLVSAATH
jgi:SAM-dependent methyltransferase